MSNAWSFETRQIHAGQEPDSATGARALPIYQTTSFVFPSAESAANRFALAELAPIYTRIGNPTQDAVEQRVASLEGGLAALLLSSGQAAETFADVADLKHGWLPVPHRPPAAHEVRPAPRHGDARATRASCRRCRAARRSRAR